MTSAATSAPGGESGRELTPGKMLRRVPLPHYVGILTTT